MPALRSFSLAFAALLLTPAFSAKAAAKAKCRVSEALDALKAGKPLAVPETGSHGCSVKYGN